MIASQLLAVAALAISAGAAEPSIPFTYPCKADRPHVAAFDRRDVVTVKFVNGYRLRAVDGKLVDAASSKAPARAVAADEFAALGRLPVARWEPVHDQPDEVIAKLCAEAAAGLGREVPDLSLQLFAFLRPGADAEQALDALNALACTEMALPVPAPAPLPSPPTLDGRQDELASAPTGIGARAAWAWPMMVGRGSGMHIADLEYSWNLAHEDLPAGIQAIGPIGPDPFNDTNHGTAVLGEIAATSNGWGTIGSAGGATINVACTITPSGTWNVSGAVTRAATTLSAGDVILIEQQLSGPLVDSTTATTQFGLVPVEWYRPNYDAIVVAVGAGRTVVEAAGNGQQNLDLAAYQSGNGGHFPFTATNDSGAVIVGAGSPTRGASSTDRSRLWFSNYGSTLDLQAAGESVFTTGYGDWYSLEGANRLYTGTFGGTSSASPIVTSAAALVQGIYKQLRGAVLTPAQLRTALRTTGSPQQAGIYPLSQNIGPRPNVTAAAFAVLGASDCNASGIPDELETIVPPTAAANYSERTFFAGDAAVLAVTASGQANLTFRWWRGAPAGENPGATLLADGATAAGSIISGAQTASLMILNVALSDADDYRCIVSSPCNLSVPATVRLLVTPACIGDINHDGVATVQDIFTFLQYWFAMDPRADLDGNPGVSVQDLFTFLIAYFTGC